MASFPPISERVVEPFGISFLFEYDRVSPNPDPAVEEIKKSIQYELRNFAELPQTTELPIQVRFWEGSDYVEIILDLETLLKLGIAISAYGGFWQGVEYLIKHANWLWPTLELGLIKVTAFGVQANLRRKNLDVGDGIKIVQRYRNKKISFGECVASLLRLTPTIVKKREDEKFFRIIQKFCDLEEAKENPETSTGQQPPPGRVL